MVTAATRRDARERAIELLYESHTKGVDVDEIVAALPLTPDGYALELARGVTDHQVELDRILSRYADPRWPVERLAVTDRTVLRLGTFELATKADVPTGAALSEAVELGGRYGSTDDTSRFVNGILAAVADEVRGSRTWTPIDVVVFDMDGVIRHWLPEYLDEVEERLGLPGGTISAAAFADPGYHDVTVGAISAEEWAAAIGTIVAAEHDVSADEVAEIWLGTTWRVDDDVVVDPPRRAEPDLGDLVGGDVVFRSDDRADGGCPLLGRDRADRDVVVPRVGERSGGDRSARQPETFLDLVEVLREPVADHTVHVEHDDVDRRPRTGTADLVGDRGENPVDEPRRVVGAAVATTEFDRFGQRCTRRDVGLGRQFERAEPEHGAVRHGEALDRPPGVGVPGQDPVELDLVVRDPPREFERVPVRRQRERGDDLVDVDALGV